MKGLPVEEFNRFTCDHVASFKLKLPAQHVVQKHKNTLQTASTEYNNLRNE